MHSNILRLDIFAPVDILDDMIPANAVNPDEISAIIRDCAARLIVPRFNKLVHSEIDTKSGPNDLVTIADRETEIELEKILTKKFPGCIVIGEEGISAKTASIETLQDREKMIWVADPVDGTYNFVHGKPEFAVMLACVINGVTQFGWIYDVPGNRMMVAERGAGAFINGTRLSVAAKKPLSETRGFCGSKYFHETMRPYIKSFAGEVAELHSLSCAGHEYLRVASGDHDFNVYNRIRPWDHLAGTLAVIEAGGVVSKWDGNPYTPQDDFGGLIAASNPEMLETLQQKLIQPMVTEFLKTGASEN